VKKLMLLIAAGSLWLFLAAIPVLADGGPHLSQVNSGSASLTADSCAGCHRIHTAKSSDGMLLRTNGIDELCLECHGAGGTGATANVEDGIQWVPTGSGARSTTQLGALRNGGFKNASIDSGNPMRVLYARSAVENSTRPKVGVGLSEAVKSAHIDLTADAPGTPDGIADTGIIWGSALSGVGEASVTLECTGCHNPHGNGQYRILSTFTESGTHGSYQTYNVALTTTSYVQTVAPHELVVNDVVTLTNVGGKTGTFYVVKIASGTTAGGPSRGFQVSATLGGSAASLTATTATGTVVRQPVRVADSSVDPDGDPAVIENPTKNYTILAVKGVQGTPGTFLLYARDVVAARAASPVAPAVSADQAAVAITSTARAFSATSYATFLTTAAATGVAVGDRVKIVTATPLNTMCVNTTSGVAAVGSDANFVPNGTANTVMAITTVGGSVYDAFSVTGMPTAPACASTEARYFVATSIADATVQRLAIAGTYTSAGGDYFRKSVPWYPKGENSSCSNGFIDSLTDPIGAAENSAFCATMNDAPNGRPNAVLLGTAAAPQPSTLGGQQAFTDQITTWCLGCHTRYYSADRSTARTDNAGTTDPNYTYQHSTQGARSCVLCHVSHGSNAAMPGQNGTTFSADFTYPDGATTSTSSRLLKVDNRGTCVLCHEPTLSMTAGTVSPTGGTPVVP
jgi:predicted CXXCH cytochrome family protein